MGLGFSEVSERAHEDPAHPAPRHYLQGAYGRIPCGIRPYGSREY
jgi:hypothetical protein